MTASKRQTPPGGNVFPVEVLGDAPPAFGVDASRLLVFSIPLDNARTEVKYYTGASTFIWVRDATSLTASLDIRFQDQRGSRLNFQQGMWIRGLRFDTLFLSNAAQPGQSLTFLVLREGPGNIDAVNPLSAASSVSVTLPTILDTIADVSLLPTATTLILPANATRREAIINNLAANTQTFRIGDLNAGAARGIELAPGGTLILSVTEAIHGFNPGAGAESLGVAETAD